MNELLMIYIIGGLFVVILAEFFFLYFILEYFSKDRKSLLDELTKLNTALVAKDANSYVMMRSIDNVRAAEKPPSPEGVDVSELDDETYDKLIKESLR